MTAREFILSRFKLKSAGKRGGVSSKQIFNARGAARDLFTVADLERELVAMQKDGVLAFTGGAVGLWWRR